MPMNPLTKCYKYNQCYYTQSIIGLIELYKDYIKNMSNTDVKMWADFQRGAHHSRIALARNIVGDLKDVLIALDSDLVDAEKAFVEL